MVFVNEVKRTVGTYFKRVLIDFWPNLIQENEPPKKGESSKKEENPKKVNSKKGKMKFSIKTSKVQVSQHEFRIL